MDHSVALLKQRVDRKQIFGVIVPYHRTRLIFAVLRFGAHDRHCHLNISVLVADAGNKIALQLTDTSNADLVVLCRQIGIYDILKIMSS